MNLFVCVQSVSLIQEIMEEISQNSKMNICGIMTDGLPSVELLQRQEVNVCLLEVNIGASKFAGFIEDVRHHMNSEEFCLLCLFKHLDTEIIQVLSKFDIQHFLVEPYTREQLFSALYLEEHRMLQPIMYESEMEINALAIMLDLGLPPHLNGFDYIKTASILNCEASKTEKQTMKVIYSKTAKKYNTTSVRVEKSVRTAIDYAYRKQPEMICIYHTKPTSSQIIHYISEKLRAYEKRK